MRCERCGKQLTNKILKYNNVTLCPECASEMGIPDMAASFSSALRFFDNDFMDMVPNVLGNLEFSPTRSQIKCPKCGMSLREFEQNGVLGCIECYNTFNDQIKRILLKNQANTRYIGRKPGMMSDCESFNSEEQSETLAEKDENISETPSASEVQDKLSKFENADLGMLDDEDLKEAIKLAVEAENYMLAARFRDELKGRGEN